MSFLKPEIDRPDNSSSDSANPSPSLLQLPLARGKQQYRRVRGIPAIFMSLKSAVRALRANILRSLLTSLGIIIGVGAVIMMISISEGNSASINQRLSTLNPLQLTIRPGSARSAGNVRQGGGTLQSLTQADADAIAQQPGVTAAGIITNMPLTGDNGKTAAAPKGYVPPAGQSLQGHYSYAVTGDYFTALGIPLREGRFLTSEDSHRAERVCVVDEDFARHYFPNGGMLGEKITQAGERDANGGVVGQKIAHAGETDDAKLFTIVGIVGRVKQAALTEPQGQGAVYIPFSYRENSYYFVVTHTSQRPEAFGGTLRKLVRAADPDLAIDNIRSMETHVADSLIARRSPALLAGIFAGVGLPLAAIGAYGGLSYAVAQRNREIGIRMAVGAQRHQIAAQFLSLGLRLLIGGTALGFIGAWWAGRAMQSVLFGVPALPVATFFGTAIVLGAVSLIACLIPARRASKVDPMTALRAE